MAAVTDASPRGDAEIASELAGLDALEQATRPSVSLAVRAWRATWPKVAAIGLALFAWQLVVWSGWRPTYVLPGPMTVLSRFWSDLGEADTWKAVATTLRRAAVGFALAALVGIVIGLAVSRFRSLRTAVGSLITGLQTMPSIAWFPLALLLFRLSEGAILFVVIIGAAPSIANGLIAGVDTVPPILTRAGRVLGARGLNEYRYVILPAALPSFLTGLKQGWAFAWRSLMAGELLVIIANQPSIGSRLQFEREFADSAGLIAVMLLILVIGVAVDAIFFSTLERHVRRRRGLGGVMTMYPVMLQVAGRRCLVVGGGRVALRKVEGLLGAGAEVTVIAPEVDARIDALNAAVERRPYGRGDVAGYRLVITATDDAAVNAAVFDDAETAGVWVNSADDIEHCSFTLPAIHRDGAITVAVSTEGQSPAFAAWLRDRVRDALPVGLADVAAQIAHERRAVHERGETTEGLDWHTRIDELVGEPASVGMVHLVGAGPGDPELLTVRAARLLAAADVVVHDALADTEALSLVPSHVERIDVGKRPGRPVPQELINDLLVQLAQRHRCVVRLKGGDPFLFGRGGEEALALQAAGVPFEIVPGITSAIAAPAAAGVPVTQRGMSASVTIVTGHRRFGDEDETDWEALARVGGTIVVLMGVAERGAIAQRLLDGGLSPDTPVTAVRYGTRPEQEVARTTLGALGDTPIEAPAAIVIGAVAGLDLSSDAIARATTSGWPPRA